VSVIGQTVDVSAEGAKAVVGGTASVVNSGLTAVQDITPNGAPSSLNTQSVQGTMPQHDTTTNNNLNRALNSSHQGGQGDDYLANKHLVQLAVLDNQVGVILVKIEDLEVVHKLE
jgi:hypothetical protein